MAAQYVPLICCARCGMIRRGDAPMCSGINQRGEICGGIVGFPLVSDIQRQCVYVDTARQVEPFAPGDDKKIVVATTDDVPPPPRKPPNLKLEP